MSRIKRLYKAYQKNTNKSVIVDKIQRVQASYEKEKVKGRKRYTPVQQIIPSVQPASQIIQQIIPSVRLAPQIIPPVQLAPQIIQLAPQIIQPVSQIKQIIPPVQHVQADQDYEKMMAEQRYRYFLEQQQRDNQDKKEQDRLYKLADEKKNQRREADLNRREKKLYIEQQKTNVKILKSEQELKEYKQSLQKLDDDRHSNDLTLTGRLEFLFPNRVNDITEIRTNIRNKIIKTNEQINMEQNIEFQLKREERHLERTIDQFYREYLKLKSKPVYTQFKKELLALDF
jgi:hypothetical protein